MNGKSFDDKIKILENRINDLSKKLIESEKNVAALQRVIDPEIKTRRLFDLIREVNGHGSAMPDMSGYNTDHDRRYLIRGAHIGVPGIYFEDKNGKLWWMGIEDGDLVTRFDVNLGVGTPNFPGGEYTRYHPNFG